jgi:hypothetical protein
VSGVENLDGPCIGCLLWCSSLEKAVDMPGKCNQDREMDLRQEDVPQ